MSADVAYDVSDAAGDSVRNAATGAIGGVRVVVDSATSNRNDRNST